MNKARLLTLANFIENEVPPERFNMAVVGKALGSDHTPGIGVEPSCQTAGCMLGWATAIPEFRDAGLKMINFSFANQDAGNYTVMLEGYSGGLLDEIRAACVFFDLTISQVRFLFKFNGGADSEETPHQAAARLRLFIQETPES